MRVLTGLQPSGKLHVGNYFGAMEPAVGLQEKGEAFYFIANYHAMTTVKDADELRAYTRELAVDFLACGLDPERAVFFLQSAVPEVNESYKFHWTDSVAANHDLLVGNGSAKSRALSRYLRAKDRLRGIDGLRKLVRAATGR